MGICQINKIDRSNQKSVHWCNVHHSPVLFSNRKSNVNCLRVTIAPRLENDPDTFYLDLSNQINGVSLWATTPPVYDTTTLAMPRGIHLHLQNEQIAHSEITCQTLFIKKEGSNYFPVELEAASTYVASAIFSKQLTTVLCVHCGKEHLDTNQGSVIPHRIHVCHYCGKTFETKHACISNPLMRMKAQLGDPSSQRPVVKSGRVLIIKQKDFPSGIRIWGSNAAIIWTFPHLEKEGIHIHCYQDDPFNPVIDQTVEVLEIDGIRLDAEMVRHFMAQQTLLYLTQFLCSLNCPRCGQPHFDKGRYALVPHAIHKCNGCGFRFRNPTSQKLGISNPIIQILRKLYVTSN